MTKEDNMKFRQTLVSILAAAFMTAVGVPQAQSGSIDQRYEAEKAAEIANAKLQLATQPGSAAVQELTEAENTLRRLKAAKLADQRRKIAAELEMAITRLKIATGAGTTQW
jgi:hypothetical protein